VAGLALILGIDRFMSEARALTNLIGNGVATVVVAKWTGDLDTARMQRHLNNETAIEADEPEQVLDATEAHMPLGSAPRTPAESSPRLPAAAAR
jgi:aerobic C4-dicarboxylate transport protein